MHNRAPPQPAESPGRLAPAVRQLFSGGVGVDGLDGLRHAAELEQQLLRAAHDEGAANAPQARRQQPQAGAEASTSRAHVGCGAPNRHLTHPPPQPGAGQDGPRRHRSELQVFTPAHGTGSAIAPAAPVSSTYEGTWGLLTSPAQQLRRSSYHPDGDGAASDTSSDASALTLHDMAPAGLTAKLQPIAKGESLQRDFIVLSVVGPWAFCPPAVAAAPSHRWNSLSYIRARPPKPNVRADQNLG
eukprot:SAG11_NODE_3322_length_2524_cov_4.138144_2_plen_243_part_00